MLRATLPLLPCLLLPRPGEHQRAISAQDGGGDYKRSERGAGSLSDLLTLALIPVVAHAATTLVLGPVTPQLLLCPAAV